MHVYETDGAAIYRQSFAMIRAEADLARFDAEQEPVAVRMIHAAGLIGLEAHLRFSPGFVATARAALAEGAPILCDARMVSQGVTLSRLPRGNEVICTLHEPSVPALAQSLSTTRSAAALALWRPHLRGAVVAIGNAPTALFHLLNMLADPDCPRPAAIIGCPVGFVGAAESKDALWAEQPAPCCIVAGRLGGRMKRTGILYGVGLGPGDPELMTVRAHRLLRGATHVAYFRKAGRPGQSRRIVEGLLPAGVVEHAMEYPVTTEIAVDDPAYNAALSAFYARCTLQLQAWSDAGHDVLVLCEGDPFFYGSFMHLYTRLVATHPVQVVPAITGMSGAWTVTGQPITWGDDVLTVLMGTLPEARLARHMADSDALVVMKIGRHLDKVRRALAAAGRLDDAWLVEFATMAGQQVVRLAQAEGRVTPYFSIVLVHGQGRRP
jgi:precorrin-2/cobalt-factor-2 C20-methyltransferase